MKLIQQSAELWEQPEGEVGIYKAIERAARLCYKSEDKATEDSYKRFMNMLNEKGHNSPLEHGTVYLKYTGTNIKSIGWVAPLFSNQYTKYDCDYNRENGTVSTYVTTNYRVLVENGWLKYLKYLCEPTEHHAKRISVHIVTNRAISHELVRHKMLCAA